MFDERVLDETFVMPIIIPVLDHKRIQPHLLQLYRKEAGKAIQRLGIVYFWKMCYILFMK